MFLRIVHLAKSTEQALLCLAAVSLSRTVHQCQLFSKDHEQILPEPQLLKLNTENVNTVLCVGIDQNDDVPRAWIQWFIAGNYLSGVKFH